MPQRTFTPGMRIFSLIWFGQLISVLGSGLTGFGIGVWIYQITGSAAQFALSNVFYLVPFVLLGPVAGALVDRWNRRRVLILADTGQALGTLTIALLLALQQLQVWHVYVVIAISATLKAFQRPAYSASVALLVPKAHLARAGGMAQLNEAVGMLLAPTLAGFLIVAIGLPGVIVIDFATFLFAVTTLLLVRIPQPERASVGKQSGLRPLRQDIVAGWKYIVTRRGLLSLLILYAFLNLFNNAAGVLTGPMVLSFADAQALGLVLSAGGLGFLAGSLVMSLSGGPKRLIHGAVGFIFAQGAGHILAGLRPSALSVAAGRFLYLFGFSVMASSAGALWQRKVTPEMQGRVFATRFTVSASIEPMAHASIGILADRVFEPLMAAGGPLSDSIGQLIGTGPGRGMGLIQLIMGGLVVLLGAIGYLNPRIRRVEDELPDTLPDERAAHQGPVATEREPEVAPTV